MVHAAIIPPLSERDSSAVIECDMLHYSVEAVCMAISESQSMG
jgi:hypothetical protein